MEVQPNSLESPILIVTDSVAQVPAQIADDLGIKIVPSIVRIDGNEYLDGVDVEPQKLYQRMRQEEFQIQTSAPPVAHFCDIFESCLQSGAVSVLYIGLTSRLSATFSSAEAASFMIKQKYPKCNIELFDSKTATVAQGFIAIEAAKEALRGSAF